MFRQVCTRSSALTQTSTCAIACTMSRRSIKIQDPNPDIKAYWRKDTENIRAQSKGVPLGSAEVQREAFEEYVALATANGNISDPTKVVKWVIGTLFVGMSLPLLVGDGSEEVGASYTPYEKRNGADSESNK
eukprot:GILI01025822.1.p1 GENE.GILI01025822.1~~GILI01025822.1.p1  ORF type:complete len:147 (-),score=7.46 GILI01025822.1:49-444(-)